MDDFTSADFSAAASATASPEASTLDASSAAPTSPAQPAGTETQAPTATTSAAPTAAPVSEKPKGPIPFEVHDTALNNARTKTRAEVEQEWQPYAWAKQVPRETWESQVALAHRMSTDPIGFLAEFVRELETHPTHAPQLRSQAGRILSSARGAPPVDLNPDLVVDDGQGHQIATFSADRVKAIVTDALQKELGPLKQDYTQRQATDRQVAMQKQIESQADAIFSEVSDILGDDKEAYAAVDRLMTQNPTWTAQRAAWHYHKTSVLPNLSKTERTKVLADISKKPAASTMSPSSGTTSAPRPDAEKSWEELFREKHAELVRR